MAFIYRAEEYEAEVLREVFGSGVKEVMFWDDEQYDGPWMVVAFDADAEEIGRIFEQDVTEVNEEVFEIPRERCVTVKFGLSL